MAADLVLTGNYTENNWKQQLGKKDFLKKTVSGILSHFEDYRNARNCLAHMKILELSTIEQILKK